MLRVETNSLRLSGENHFLFCLLSKPKREQIFCCVSSPVKGNGYTCKGGNSVKKVFVLLVFFYRKESAPEEQTVSFQSRPHFQRGLVYRKIWSHIISHYKKCRKSTKSTHCPYLMFQIYLQTFYKKVVEYKKKKKNLDSSLVYYFSVTICSWRKGPKTKSHRNVCARQYS